METTVRQRRVEIGGGTTWLRRFVAPGLAFCLLSAVAEGCKKVDDEMDGGRTLYTRYIWPLDYRWDEALASFRSDKPDIVLARVLVNDMDLIITGLKSEYRAPNRDAAIAKLQGVHDRYFADLQTVLNMNVDTALQPGKSEKDVLACVKKAFKDYQEFRPLVAAWR